MSKPNFFLVENNSKGVILVLPFEAHTIQANVTKKGYLNYFKVQDVDPVTLREWAGRNIRALSQIAWYAYDLGRYRERMVATNLVREVEIDLDKYSGWAFR